MTVNPVDLQIILPQSGQVNKLSRGLQFQQQIEQQVVAQQAQESLRREQQKIKKTGDVKGSRIENEEKEQGRGDSYEPSRPQLSLDEKEKITDNETTEKEKISAKSKLGSVLDIKI